MEIHQLKTFVAVAREGSITRASEQLHLSQPAVSAHIRAIEETLGLALFERTPRGMSLTGDGQQLLLKAEQTLTAHRGLIEEATRIKGQLSGTFRLGAGRTSSPEALGLILTNLSERCPEVTVSLQHGTSHDILNGLRSGNLDAGLYNEVEEPDDDLHTIEVERFGLFLAAPVGLVSQKEPLDWQLLSELPWICPTSNTCCGHAMENLFLRHQIRPSRIINIDREAVTRTLIAGGVGLGLLHAYTAKSAESTGNIELIHEIRRPVSVLFAHLKTRAEDPVLNAVTSIVRTHLLQQE